MRTTVFKHGVFVLILTGFVFLALGCASGGPAVAQNSRSSGSFLFAPVGVGSGVVILDYTGRDKQVIIPAEIEGKPVRVIGTRAFENKDTITEVVIPDGVTSIGDGAFNKCFNLASVTIPDSVTEIGGAAFDECGSLALITIPPAVTSIGWLAFRGCRSLVSVTIPAGVKTIGNSAFSSCDSLTTVTFGEGAAVVFGRDVFEGSRLDANSQLAVEKARAGAADMVLVQATAPDAPEPPVTEDDFQIKQNAQGGITITRYTGKARNVAIPATISGLPVTEIAEGVFRGRLGLTGISIPNGITTIGAYAFGSEFLPSGIRKNNFQNLVIPDSVTWIGSGAFYDCGIRTLNLGKGLQYIGGDAFNGNEINELTIPDSVTEIGGSTSVGSGAFANCGIRTLNLGKSLAKIGANAFNSNNLTEITLPASLRTIGQGAFGNNQLTALVIPNGVVYIESGQFANLTPFAGNPLASLTIPPSLVSRYYNVTDWDESGYRGFAGSFSGLPITRITLPANVDERNLRQFGESFVNFWNLQGKKAGTYVYTGRIWTVQ
jgi:hypothetical protein